MYKIGVIGDYDSISGFSVLGFDIYPTDSLEEAESILSRLSDNGYGIIYVTEQFLKDMPDVIDEYREKKIPSVVPVPSVKGSTGFGRSCLKKYVEQAVGSDVIFNDE
ncbi:MAG: V-type ATP synthase subunit F [Clostridia bacterium]|nr:V-type ATP synthase subunit F [Clostridia bacterium]